MMTTRGFGLLWRLALCYIIPVVTAILLLWFNIHGFYIGGELSGRSGGDDWKLLGLQVAAVGFWLLLLASLSHMLSRVTRPRDNLGRSPSPVGTPTGIPSDQIPLLFAKESSTSTEFLKHFMAPLTILCVGVALLATATAVVIPNLSNWDAGGTTFWLNATLRDLWPSRLDKGIEPDKPCVIAGESPCFPSNIESMGQLLSFWPQVDPLRKVMPEQVGILGRIAVRNLEVRFRGPFDYQPYITSATIPSAQIADALSELATYWSEANTRNCVEKKVNFCYYNDIRYAVEALQSVVFVRCNSNTLGDTLRFPRLDRGLGNFPLVDLDRAMLNISTDSASHPTLRWIDLPEAAFGSSSIGAVVSVPVNNQSRVPDSVLACTVDARWARSTAKILYSSGPMVVSGSPVNWFTSGRFQTGSDGTLAWNQVKLSLHWAHDIDSISQLKTSVFALLSSYLAANSTLLSIPYSENAVEAILAIMLAESMSRTTSTATIQGTLKGLESKDWMDELLPKRHAFGGPGNAFDYPQGSGDKDTKLQMQTTVNGYGYGITRTRIPALVVLGLYLAVTSFCMMFLLWQRLYHPSNELP